MIGFITWMVAGWVIFELSASGARLQGVELGDHMSLSSAILWVTLWPLVLLIALFGVGKE